MSKDPASPTALERLVRQGTDADLRRFLLLLQPPEIADLIEALRSDDDRARAFRAIVGKERAEVLRDMEDGEAASIVEEMTASEAADLLEDMQSDDAADVLQALAEHRKVEVLEQIEREDREEIEKVLGHPEDSAGGIMQTELVSVTETQRAREVVEEIRRTRDDVGELHEIFVTDEEGRLTGWVKERALILADDDTPIGGITTPVPVSVPVTMDQEEIASFVRDYDMSSIPVVDEDNQLLGRILVDDIVDVLEEEATEDIVRMGGSGPGEIYEPSVLSALKARSPWLVVTFAGGLVAAFIIHAGDDLVKQAGALFAFIPVIMGMGGGAATQTATVTVRSLALGRVGRDGVGRVVLKELLVGTVLAAGTGVLLWVAAVALDGDVRVAWIASFALFGTVSLGTFLGVLTPLVLDRLGADPAVATSPFVTTLNDLIGSSLIILFCFLILL